MASVEMAVLGGSLDINICKRTKSLSSLSLWLRSGKKLNGYYHSVVLRYGIHFDYIPMVTG